MYIYCTVQCNSPNYADYNDNYNYKDYNENDNKYGDQYKGKVQWSRYLYRKRKENKQRLKYINNVFLTDCITGWTISICLLLQ